MTAAFTPAPAFAIGLVHAVDKWQTKWLIKGIFACWQIYLPTLSLVQPRMITTPAFSRAQAGCAWKKKARMSKLSEVSNVLYLELTDCPINTLTAEIITDELTNLTLL